MMNRRKALLGMSVAALGSAVPSASALVRLLKPGLPGARSVVSGVPSDDAANADIDDRLRKDIAQMASRVNSEEGVPVFLACVNLVVDKSSRTAALTALNTAVVAEFGSNAAAWERIKPNSPGSDVATLIQVLAERNLANGGTEKN